MTYDEFCDLCFKAYPLCYVQPSRDNGRMTVAHAVCINNGKCFAIWMPRRGVVWHE